MINRKRIGIKIGSILLAAAMLHGCGAGAAGKKDSQAATEAAGSGLTDAGNGGSAESGKDGLAGSGEDGHGRSKDSVPSEMNAGIAAQEPVQNAGKMPAFTAKDLQGNEVTESIFGEKDLTVVNIWGTFCPPCIGEMPELGEWAEAMPDNVQIVGLIIDIQGEDDQEHLDLAVEITEKAGAKFTQIIANEDFYGILSQVVGVPTTLFVDKEGNLAGPPIVGADVDGYKKFVEDYLGGQ